MVKRLVALILIVTFLYSCNSEQSDSRQKSKSISNELSADRTRNIDEIRKLNSEIDSLRLVSESLDLKLKIENLSQIFLLSNIDHIIILVNDLQNSKSKIINQFGFLIKNGSQHKNGITNYFVKFSNNFEMEFMTVNNPSDELANFYSEKLKVKEGLIKMAIEVDDLNRVDSLLMDLGLDNNRIIKNKNFNYLVLNNDLNEPIFFIHHMYKTKSQKKYLNSTCSLKSLSFSSDFSNGNSHSSNLVKIISQNISSDESLVFRNGVLNIGNKFVKDDFELTLKSKNLDSIRELLNSESAKGIINYSEIKKKIIISDFIEGLTLVVE